MDTEPSPPVSDKFIVETILPKHELHIIGGPAHAGKSTLEFLMMNDYAAGMNIFGYASYFEPFCYVSCVHTLSACRNIENRFESKIPMISAIDSGGCKNFDEVLEAADRKVPGVKVIFLDGILRIAGNNGMDNATVGDFLSGLVHRLQESRITLIATGRCAKPKDTRSPVRSIDRFLGATAWTELSSTFIAIEPFRATNPRNDRRVVTLMPKSSPAMTFHYRFTVEGKLVEVADDGTADSPERVELLAMLIESRPKGTEISTADLLQMGVDIGVIARSTMMRYISLLVRQGRLLDGGYGKYLVPRSQ